MQPLTVSGRPAVLPSDARMVVLGLGYVGLPLALSFVEAGVSVVGLDVNSGRVDELRSGRSPIDDVSDARLGAGLRQSLDVRRLDLGAVQSADAVIVCVPTPMDAARQPDLGPVLAAASFVRTGLRAGHLVVLQSTTYPGTTVGPFRTALESGLELRAGIDYDLAFAPERVSPGDPASAARDVPRLVGGVTAHSTSRAAALFGRINSHIVEVSSPDVAELAKLHENIFRNVNIALVNQLALLCERMGLDVWEVIDAAATKPFGFMPFRPGLESVVTASRSIRTTLPGALASSGSSIASWNLPGHQHVDAPPRRGSRCGSPELARTGAERFSGWGGGNRVQAGCSRPTELTCGRGHRNAPGSLGSGRLFRSVHSAVRKCRRRRAG